jgi:hypothetical protein
MQVEDRGSGKLDGLLGDGHAAAEDNVRRRRCRG